MNLDESWLATGAAPMRSSGCELPAASERPLGSDRPLVCGPRDQSVREVREKQ